jgi:repressor LexA
MKPLTKRQAQVLAAVNDWQRRFGYSPSLEELADRVGLRSVSCVYAHLTRIEVKGYIRRVPHARRCIEILVMPEGVRAA